MESNSVVLIIQDVKIAGSLILGMISEKVSARAWVLGLSAYVESKWNVNSRNVVDRIISGLSFNSRAVLVSSKDDNSVKEVNAEHNSSIFC